MDFSKSPTDNLYKYIAISGVCLFVYCSNLFIDTWNDYHKQKHNLDVDKEVVSIEQKSIYDDKNTLNNEFKSFIQLSNLQLQGGDLSLEDLRNGKITESEFRNEIDKRMYDLMTHEKSLLKLRDDIQENQKKLDILQKKIVSNEKIFSKFFKESTILFIMWILSFVTSICLMLYGFSRWYSRLQVPLDKKLNNEIKAPRRKRKPK